MQNLRDQLLKAGIITEDQKKKTEAQLERKPHGKKEPRRDNKDAKDQPQQQQQQQQQAKDQPPQPQPQKPKLSKKQLMKQPLNRMLDLSDPKTLKILQAIEAHRVREETKGEIPFHFTLRDGHVRKIMINQAASEGLESGRFAIVEDGEPNRHVIVGSGAVAGIKEVDPDAVRFAN